MRQSIITSGQEECKSPQEKSRLSAPEKRDSPLRSNYWRNKMGNIRPSFIKIRAIRLLELYPDQFTDDFDNNKKLVSEFSDVGNKRMRNWIAGYITRYKQRRVD